MNVVQTINACHVNEATMDRTQAFHAELKTLTMIVDTLHLSCDLRSR